MTAKTGLQLRKAGQVTCRQKLHGQELTSDRHINTFFRAFDYFEGINYIKIEGNPAQPSRATLCPAYLTVGRCAGQPTGRHRGLCALVYHRNRVLEQNYEWIGKIEDGQTVYRSIGIDICEPDVWGNGMLRCAEKLGFVECNRNVDTREVDGKKYAGLTFRLEK